MKEFDNNPAISQTVELMNSYGLDLHGHTIPEVISQLLNKYDAKWVRLATIEALYLGRYKVVSVEQILSVWLRLGNPNPHFSHEFERLICRKLPRNSTELPENASVASSLEEKILEEKIAALGKKKAINSGHSSAQVKTMINNHQERKQEDSIASASESVNSTQSGQEIPQQKDRSRLNSQQPTIDEFTPLPDVSGFYNKLKSLAEEKSEE